MPKLSIVIPTYNRAELVVEAIHSALNQTFRDIEVIVVDDGSTDNTREVVSALPVTYYWQPNQGPAAAYNKGIEMATGEYITLLDSDDVLLQDALEKGVKALDEHPQAAFSYGQAYQIDTKGRIVGLERPATRKSSLLQQWVVLRDYLLFGNHITSSTVMLRRTSLQEAGGCDSNLRSGSEDLDLWLRLAKKYPVVYIAEPLAKFREHPGKFSSHRDLVEWENTNSAIIQDVLRDPSLSSIASSLRPKAYFRLYSESAARFLDRGDRKGARRRLWIAIRSYPTGLLTSSEIPWLLVFSKTLAPHFILRPARRLKRLVAGLRLGEGKSAARITLVIPGGLIVIAAFGEGILF